MPLPTINGVYLIDLMGSEANVFELTGLARRLYRLNGVDADRFEDLLYEVGGETTIKPRYEHVLEAMVLAFRGQIFFANAERAGISSELVRELASTSAYVKALGDTLTSTIEGESYEQVTTTAAQA